MPLLNTADDVKLGEQQILFVALGQDLVWPLAEGGQPKISSVSSAGTLSVSWDEVVNAELYELRRNGELIATQVGRIYNDSGLDWGASYSYRVTPIIFGVPGTESPVSINAVIPKGKVGALSASSRTLTNVTVSWAVVPGATHYEIRRNNVVIGTQTGTSKAVSTSEDTSINIYVRPFRNGILGLNSSIYTYYSGRSEERDQGSRQDMVFEPSKVDSWRPVDGWSWLANIAAQGYFTAAYGNYKGVIFYGSNGVRGALRDRLGTNGVDRQLKGSCTSAEVYLFKKAGVGTSGTVTTNIHVSNSDAGGPEPGGQNSVSRTSTSGGNGKWYNISDANGQRLGDGSFSSLMLRNDGAADYAQFTDGRLRLSWSWNYVVQAAKANTWGLA
jgi:hypothetical protein